MTEPQSAESGVPVIMEAGSRSKVSIRQLKKGRGPLMREVNEIVQEVRSTSGQSSGVVPVIIVYRQKRRRRNRLRIPLPIDLFR